MKITLTTTAAALLDMLDEELEYQINKRDDLRQVTKQKQTPMAIDHANRLRFLIKNSTTRAKRLEELINIETYKTNF